MFNTPLLDHTEPAGKPAADIGMFLIDRLFTNVVHVLSVVSPCPMTNDKLHVAEFPTPPKIPE